jgi:hypothetical protein
MASQTLPRCSFSLSISPLTPHVHDRSGLTYHQYNLETITAVVRTIEAKRSPTQTLLFPWTITYTNGLLVNLAADVCRSANVRITLHLSHAQSGDTIKVAADVPGYPHDNILVRHVVL